MSGRVYIGTRSSAIKGSLLSRNTIETLVESTTLEEFVNRLRGTPYSSSLSKLQQPYSARRLELAFRERFTDIHFLLMRAASNYELLKLYYLKNIVWDLKSVLKSKALGKSDAESIEYLDLHSEELVGRRELIAKILSAKDIQEAATLLSGTEFGNDVEKAVTAYLNTKEVRFFDIYLDRSVLSKISKYYLANIKFYTSSRAVDRAGIGEIVAIDIDSYNVLSILRAKLWGLHANEIRDLIIQPTFKFPSSILQGMIDAELTSEAVKLLRGFTIPESGVSDEDIINAVEERFITENKEIINRNFIWQGLGISNALALIKLIELEVRNLSAIAIGIEARLTAKDIISKLSF
jgi:V/A-type H+-transporting ATPase subunit C